MRTAFELSQSQRRSRTTPRPPNSRDAAPVGPAEPVALPSVPHPSAVRSSEELAIRREFEPIKQRVRFVVTLGTRPIAEYFVEPEYETPDDGDLLLEHARRKHASLIARGGLRLIAS